MKRYIISLLLLLLGGILAADFLYYGSYYTPGQKLKDIDAVTKATPSAAGYDRDLRVSSD